MKKETKIAKVMREFKAGKLKSSSGQKVTNPKQGIAIALSEADRMKSGDWIKGAIEKPGSLRKSLGVKSGEKIPAGKLAEAAKKSGKMGQRARLAQTLRKMK